MSDGGAHAFDEAFAAFVDNEANAAGVGVCFEDGDFGGRGWAVFEYDAFRKGSCGGGCHAAIDPRDVYFVDLKFGVREPMRYFAIVREEECAGDIHIEASDGKDPGRDAV